MTIKNNMTAYHNASAAQATPDRQFLTHNHFTSIFKLILLLLLLLGTAVQAEEILKSPNDNRDYAAVTLANGLRVILVSDPDTDKAAASLDINIGYYQDPDDRPGLAHFLEHMLFLGTRKYPDADAYKEFISSHGGMDNAFTGSEHTNYFFDIDKDFLDPTLDRFAQFFIAPLFNEEYVQREMNAVDSEYRLKIKDDGRRIYETFKITANNKHPFSKFSVGNLDSLGDRDANNTRDELIRFYNKYYSANLMTLAVIGKEPIAELKKMVQRFAAIKNHAVNIKPVTAPLFKKDQQQVRLQIKPLQELRLLTLSFTTPWHQRYYREKPFQILGHLLGYEGKNSLHALLKQRGWINSLSAGSGTVANNYTTFDIDLDLTEAGLQHSDEITTLVFQAINLVRRHGIKRWIHDEIDQISELNFRFSEKGRPGREVVSLAGNLHNYPAHMVIKGPYVSESFSAHQIESILADFNSTNLRQIIVAPTVTTDQIEPYYDTAYSIKPLTKKQLKAWQQAGLNPHLAIPPANPFIPDDTDVLSNNSGQDIPELIIEQDGFRVWHKQDDEFNTPRADINVGLASTVASETLHQSLMTSLYTALVNDHLNAFAYPAALAGLHYRLNKGERGIGFSVAGYDDKQQLMISRIIDTMMSYKVNPERFAVIRERMKRDWENTRLDRPYQQLNRALNTLLQPRSWTPESYLNAVDNISITGLERHIAELKKAAHINMLIHGNINRTEAVKIAADMNQRLRQQIKPAPQLTRHAIKLDNMTSAHHFSMDIDHNDSAIISYHQAADDSTQTQARNLLLLQILETPFFNELRTNKQLGYVVYAGLSRNLRLPAIKFVIQSPVTGPAALLGHIDEFIQRQFTQIKDMDNATFADHQQAILTRLLEKDKRMSERSRRYSSALALKYYNFNHREELAQAIRALSPADISDYYQTLLLAKQQRRIIIESTGHKHRRDDKTAAEGTATAEIPAVTELTMESIEAFRASQGDYSL